MVRQVPKQLAYFSDSLAMPLVAPDSVWILYLRVSFCAVLSCHYASHRLSFFFSRPPDNFRMVSFFVSGSVGHYSPRKTVYACAQSLQIYLR